MKSVKFNVVSRLDGDAAVIYPKGYLNNLSGESLVTECSLYIGKGITKIVVNFSETDLINSIGISLLLQIIEDLRNIKGTICFTNMSKFLRDTFEMRRRLGAGPSVIGSGGVSDLQSAVEQIMMGADAVWICTETMLRGFSWMGKLLQELRAYMKEMGWSHIAQFQGLLIQEVRSAAELVMHSGHAVLDEAACTRCGVCWEIGHCPAISHPDGKTVIDASKCLACSTCVDVCARGALTLG